MSDSTLVDCSFSSENTVVGLDDGELREFRDGYFARCRLRTCDGMENAFCIDVRDEDDSTNGQPLSAEDANQNEASILSSGYTDYSFEGKKNRERCPKKIYQSTYCEIVTRRTVSETLSSAE